ncbi:MAG: hypothetical protein ACI4VQ_01680 [Clostridia bacterium]
MINFNKNKEKKLSKKTNRVKENGKQKEEDSPKIQNAKFHILAIVAIIIFCVSICPVTLQNDTYYTIKIGEHILETGTVDMQDPFSWHEDLPYTYPHWAYDVMIYLIYSVGGMLGIFISTVVFACVLGILMYFTNYKISKNKLVSFMITIGALFLIKPYIAARAQLVTFILLELTILFIEKFLETKQKRYGVGIILISIAIANLHCAVWPFFFVLFLPYIAEYLIFTIIDANLWYKLKLKFYDFRVKIYNKKIEKQTVEDKKKLYNDKINKLVVKKENAKQNFVETLQKRENRRQKPYRIRYEKNKATKWLILIMIICAFTGLLTPLGDTPYTYLYKTMQGNTTQSISEHLPLTLINNKEMLVVLVAILMLLIFTDTKIRAKDLFMMAGLTLLMFMTRRQESMFILFGSAILAKWLSDLFRKYDNKGLVEFEKIMISTLGTIATILIIALIAIVEIRPKVNDKFINESSYPVAAAEFIKENLDVNSIHLFNEYNYGSYLLYQGIPVFIDSRADLYAPEFNGERQEDGSYDGRDIFSDYINTSSIAKYYEDTFEKYDITHIILYKNSKLNMLIGKDENYTELYSDEKFIIYARN